jgi:hypothetical protein
VLKALGFSRRLLHKEPPEYRYEHKASGALISLPTLPENDGVLDYHMLMVRHTLDQFGVADPTAFAAELQKVG